MAVLVVEDEPLLLLDAVDLMEDAGFTTYGVGNADAAIRLLETHPEIRVLFTDVDMPGTMDGLKLAAYVRDRWPPVVLIVTSGFWTVKPSVLPDDCLFLPKPYAAATLLQAIHAIAP